MAPVIAPCPAIFMAPDDAGELKKFTSGGFLDEFTYDQIAAENLLKAPDDLTDITYWQINPSLTVSDQGSGVFRLTKIASGWKQLAQEATNWFPSWAGCISTVAEVRAGTLDYAAFVLRIDGASRDVVLSIISGPGTADNSNSWGEIQDLETDQWTKVLVTIELISDIKGWATEIQPFYCFPGAGDAGLGWIEVRNCQAILGDELKPRPVNQETDYPMMAYRPNWRLTDDGKGRCHVVDTDGLIWNGEATDILIAPASSTYGDCPADCIIYTLVTVEDTKTMDLRFRINDVSNCLVLEINASRIPMLYKIISGAWTPIWTGSALTDAEKYRFRIEALGSSIKMYIDDKLEDTITETQWQTDVGLHIAWTLVTNDIRIVTESNPKAPGLIIAGGKATPDYLDPMIHWTEPDGGGFSNFQGAAGLWTLKRFSTSGALIFSRSHTAISYGSSPVFQTSATNIKYNNETTVSLLAGVEKSFIEFTRSSTHGRHALVHNNGKEWQRFNVNVGAIKPTVYPCIANHSSSVSCSRIALLNLSTKWDYDFADVTDSSTAWENGLVHEMSFHVTGQITTPVTWVTNQNCHYFCLEDTTPSWLWQFNTNGALNLMYRAAGGSYFTKATVPGIFSADTTYDIDFTYDDLTRTHRCYVDGALKIDYIDTENLDKNGPETGNDGGQYWTSVTIHPYPALGMAKANWIHPQAGEADTEMGPDNRVEFRNYQLPPSFSILFLRGVATGSPPYCYTMGAESSGEWNGREYDGDTNPQRLYAGPGTVQDDDDMTIVFDGSYLELFQNGVSLASYGSGIYQANPNVKQDDANPVTVDNLEFWPNYEYMPFKL